ncbi:MAG: YncE family protein, partial [Pyrinomonadaceae bacterium]
MAIFIFAAGLRFFVPLKSQAELPAADNQLQNRKVAPAGKLLIDAATNAPAVMPLTFNFVRSPDNLAKDGKGRFLIAVNSGYGLTFNSKSKPQQTLSVIDLNHAPEPQVIQNIYFPSPQSANFGLVFDKKAQPDGKFNLYLAGGFENRIWILSFNPAAEKPLAPANAPDDKFDAPFIDVSAFAENAPSPNYNDNAAAVYPTGVDLSPDGNALFVANNLGDTLGVVSDLRDTRRISRINLQRPDSTQFV